MPVSVGKEGIVRVTGREMTALRAACYERDRGRCVDCAMLLVLEAGEWDSMQLAHVRTKRNHGDLLQNVRAKCARCHAWEHAGGKPCPKKVKP